jgi:transcription elongation factor
MAKITLENGMVIEGTIEELKQMGVEFPVKENTEAEKWAKIGRGPNEFKEGDVVRVLNGEYSDLSDGDIGEIAQIDNDDVPYRVNTSEVTDSNWLCAEDIELITPVEARFDR